MKKSMTEYISALTENNYERLEELISNRYRKFITLYWLICDYSDFITAFEYKDTDSNQLKIKLKLHDIDVDEVYDHLISQINDESSIQLELLSDGMMHIHIYKDESELP